MPVSHAILPFIRMAFVRFWLEITRLSSVVVLCIGLLRIRPFLGSLSHFTKRSPPHPQRLPRPLYACSWSVSVYLRLQFVLQMILNLILCIKIIRFRQWSLIHLRVNGWEKKVDIFYSLIELISTLCRSTKAEYRTRCRNVTVLRRRKL